MWFIMKLHFNLDIVRIILSISIMQELKNNNITWSRYNKASSTFNSLGREGIILKYIKTIIESKLVIVIGLCKFYKNIGERIS